MGKTTSSCFKCITCTGDSVDHNDIGVPESKGSSGRGWSFRKRSTRHRVLSNTVISEAPSCANQENPELTAANSQLQPNLTISENTSLTRCTEEAIELSAQPDTKVVKYTESSRADASESDDELVICHANNLGSNSCKSIAPPSSHPQLQSIEELYLTYEITEYAPIETKETDQISDPEAKILANKEETGGGLDIAAEQSDSEATEFSRKVSNPSFIAAESKFEELSSAGSSVNLTTSSSQDRGVDSSLHKVSSSIDQPFSTRKIGLADNSMSNATAVQMGGSECGTELSISSTLDSPDRPEVEENNPKKESSILGSDPSYTTNTCQLERHGSVDSMIGGYASSIVAIDSPQLQQEPEADPSGVPLKLESEATHPMEKSLPAASPRSCRTIPESQATPASQVSVKPKKGRGEKGESNQKSRSSSGDKTSRITWEQEGRKIGKRRNSFGSTRSYDHANQEPRDSSSSNSLPSYMQATESARAKAIVNSSPRSSPDVHDKDIYIKKRLSLPGTDGRQGSFRIQRSLSQAQQKAKGNETHSLLDQKWRR